MRLRRRPAVAIALTTIVLLALAARASARPAAGPGTRGAAAHRGPAHRDAAHRGLAYRDACPAAPRGYARCFARLVVAPARSGGTSSGPGLASAPSASGGYGPADLRSAYRLPSATGGAGRTVAVVAAYDHPAAEADLARYRAWFGLPSCTADSGCFRKVDQRGGSALPPPQAGWAQEISLDVDMVSAVCPRCRILLVEADSGSLADLAAAVSRAAAMGAEVISNSYGTPESPDASRFDAAYDHPGHVLTAAAGDSGYGPYFPASSQYVTAVGGTRLTRTSGGRGWSESVWRGSGSGCSKLFPKPSWQSDRGCAKRTVADVSAVADPATGVAVYHTYGVRGGPWRKAGGTSVAAPIVAAAYALAGNAASVRYGSFPYAHAGSLNDVTAGANGSCGGSYLCTAEPGYDGPSGLGTPNGSGAF